EVRSAVVYGSVIVVLVFVPVFLLDGLAGSFFRPLALAYVLAIGASLLVALTVTPALCLWLLPGAAARPDAPLVVALKRRYRRALPRLVARPRAAMAVAAGAVALAAASVPLLGEEFLPSFKETDFLMHFVEKPGTSLEAMKRVTVLASKRLRAIPGVRSFGAHIGRAEVADEVVGPNFTELWISTDPEADHDATLAQVQAVVDGYPGLQRDVLTYLRERIKEVLTGASGGIVVRIFGNDMAALRDNAEVVRAAMEKVDGVSDLKVESQILVPQLEVRLRPEAAASFGMSAAQVQRAAGTLVKGTTVGEIYRDQRAIAVSVWGTPAVRVDVEALRSMPIETPTGATVPLGELASVAMVPAPNELKHERASRRIDVSCNARGRDLGAVSRSVEAVVRALPFPPGHHPELIGEFQARQASQRRLLGFGALSLLGIVLVLYLDFRSVRLTLLVLLTLPFALIGGVVGAFLGGGVLSLGSLVGFVTVLGIAARNGIMLVSHYRHLEQTEGVPFGASLVLQGAEERLAPILMTALAAGLALLPLVVRGNVPGHEIEHPMAMVILFGLVSSTALNLFILPSLYARFARAQEPAPT
ncbi:MAG: efflux RND transporter permease subunit, partial [Polyangiaceae bacterium]